MVMSDLNMRAVILILLILLFFIFMGLMKTLEVAPYHTFGL